MYRWFPRDPVVWSPVVARDKCSSSVPSEDCLPSYCSWMLPAHWCVGRPILRLTVRLSCIRCRRAGVGESPQARRPLRQSSVLAEGSCKIWQGGGCFVGALVLAEGACQDWQGGELLWKCASCVNSSGEAGAGQWCY